MQLMTIINKNRGIDNIISENYICPIFTIHANCFRVMNLYALQCVNCKTIVADSLCESQEIKILSAVAFKKAHNVVLEDEICVSCSGHTVGCSFKNICCSACGKLVGKFYVCTFAMFDHLRSQFTFDLEATFKQILGDGVLGWNRKIDFCKDNVAIDVTTDTSTELNLGTDSKFKKGLEKTLDSNLPGLSISTPRLKGCGTNKYETNYQAIARRLYFEKGLTPARRCVKKK